ncbi:MAG: hypothetical protein AseanaTS_02450 [Candidatus Pelagadaptatus aseana]|uniref:sulfotransferase family 2 domain-containing protein n=1 Tax=Candidatus Pelagadaptatus aseana TaxID=3120508 RepID=UPI0039B1789C
MSVLTRLLWKSLSRQNRDYFLSKVPAHEQGPYNKILSNRAEFPAAYDTNKVVFIHVPKVAGSSLVNPLLEGKWVGHLPLSYIESFQDSRYQDYLKVGFVRNPWSRLVSAFNYLSSGGAPKRDGKWVDMVNGFSDFNDFVEHWLSPENIYKQMLFVPQLDFLTNSTGAIGVDYLGRFETIESDFDEISKKLKIKSNLPRNNVGTKVDYRILFSDKSAEKVAEIYRQDISAFGYKFD